MRTMETKKTFETTEMNDAKKFGNTEVLYDYLIVGAGLYGSVFAHEMTKKGKRCLVIEKRNHIGGNVYTKVQSDIHVHVYGAHIFHTNQKETWQYLNQFAELNQYINSPMANYKGKLYNLPFNMNTFYQMWGKSQPSEVEAIIREQCAEIQGEPQNLEEQAIRLVGRDVYEKLIKGYTEKQWGRSCTELPSFIIKRIPVRYTYDNNYFNDRYQGIPIGGYTAIIEKMLEGSQIMLNTDYLSDPEKWNRIAKKVVYTGPIDAFYQYCFGALEYRSVRFETQELDIPNYQGNAVVNYTDNETPFTRIIEHKHFEYGNQPHTIISREYSEEWQLDKEPYYPINDARNQAIYERYKDLSEAEPHVIFGGRLADYKYYNMDQVIESALESVKNER